MDVPDSYITGPRSGLDDLSGMKVHTATMLFLLFCFLCCLFIWVEE